MNTFRIYSKHLISGSRKTVKFKFAVFLLTILINLLIISFNSYLGTNKVRLFQLYGEWRYVIPHLTYDESQYGGISTNIASITMKNNNNEYIDLGPISTIDKKAEELFHLQLLLGKMPEKEKEIAVEATTLSSLGIDYKLGQKITLPVNEKEEMDFYLVGIIKPYRYQWCLFDKNIIPTAIVKIKESSDKILWLSNEDYKQNYERLNLAGFDNTFAYDQSLLIDSINWKYVTVFIGMLLMVYSLVFFISKKSFKFIKKEIDILDKLGISLKDKKKIKIWSLFYLSKSSISLGFTVTVLFFCMLSLCKTDFVISIPLLLCIFATLLIFFILFITYPLKQHTTKNRKKPVCLKEIHYFFGLNKKFNACSFSVRKIQVFITYYFSLIILTSVYLSVILFCIFSQISCIEKSKILLKQETDSDYIVSFNNYYFHETDPYGINLIDIESLHEIEAIEDVFTVKVNDADYMFEGREKSEQWGIYTEYLNYYSTQNEKERQNPYVLGFSKSDKISELLLPYIPYNFWNNDTGIVTNQYFKIDYADDPDSNEIVSVLSMQDNGSDGHAKDLFLKNDMLLTFSDRITVSLTAVLDEYSFLDYLNLPNEPYTVAVNDQTFKKVFPDHETIQYVFIQTNDAANFTTDQQIMNIFSKYDNVTVNNTRIHKENIRSDLNRQMFLLSVVQILVTFTWILFYMKISVLKELSSKKMKIALMNLGINKKFFICNSIFESFFVSLPSVICLYVFYRYQIKNMIFEINIHDVITEYRVLDYLVAYRNIIITVILSILLLLFFIELIFQSERSK